MKHHNPGAWMETFGNFIFWMIKIFLLLIGFALILGGGFCVVMPLFERSGGYEIIFVGVGLAALLIGSVTFWAALRIIRKSSAAQAQACLLYTSPCTLRSRQGCLQMGG